MILDTIDQISNYKGICPNLDKGIDFLRAFCADSKPEGRYEIDGDDAYLMIQRVSLKPREDLRYEAHARYADIQYALEDGEEMGFMPVSKLAFGEYDEAKDARFAPSAPGEMKLNMQKGMFAIFFPNDGHSPCRARDEQKQIRKIVVKVRV